MTHKQQPARHLAVLGRTAFVIEYCESVRSEKQWIPACAGMTAGGVPGYAVRTIIPACAGMTEEGVPGCAVRTVIPAFAGMTELAFEGPFPQRPLAPEKECHTRESGDEGQNP